MNAGTDSAAPAAGLIRMSADKPLVLDKAHVCHQVAGGALDVFLARGGDGPDAGRREHLFTAGVGDSLFGLTPETGGLWRLIAVGGADCSVARLETFSAPEVDNWLASLTGILVGRPTLAASTEALAPRASARHAAGARLVSGGGVVWACLEDGRATYMDAGPGFAPLEPGVFTPLTGRAWISLAQDSAIATADTAELLARGLAPGALSAFHRRFVAGLEARAAAMRRQDRRRFEDKARHDRAAMGGALFKVASVLRGGGRPCPDAAGGADPLLAACRLVAKACRIPLPENASLADKGDPGERVRGLALAAGFRVRQVALDKDWFRRDGGPLLVFHGASLAPCAALPRGARRYDLYDTATGKATVVDAAVAEGISGRACMFYTPLPNRPVNGLDLLAFALRGQETDLFTILAIGALAAMLGLVAPVLTATVIDTVIPEADVGMLTQIGGLILVCALAAAMFEIAKEIALLRVAGKVDARVQAAVTDRLLGLPTSFFKNYASGDLAARCLGVNAINSILSGLGVNAVLVAVFSSFNLALLFYYDWRMALLANAFVLANAVLVGLLSAFIVKRQRALVTLKGREQGMELEYLSGLAKLRQTGAESRAFAAWAEVFSRAATLGFQAGGAANLISAVNAAFPTLASMALFHWFFHAGTDSLNLGRFLSFYAAFAAFQVAMVQLVSLLPGFLAVIPLYERARPILRASPEVDESKADPGDLKGEIEVSHVTFCYEPEGRPILSDLSLRMAPGEFVALVGGSGAGKSTLLRLLLGFETPRAGTVYYDGQDLRDLDVRELRRRIGVVLQDDKPCSGSLFDNIVGSSGLGMEAAWEAAALVGLKTDIEAMPMGMHTMVPPGGAGFSGGQIQRLLIARALVRRPTILYFDEATSALDNTTQAVVARSIASLKVTRLVIAHRLSTVMGADRIYALRQGRVAEAGTFQELMDKKGFFYALANRQIV